MSETASPIGPIGQAGGVYPYAYTRNPLTQVDVRGLDPCDGTRRRPASAEEPDASQHPPHVPTPHGDSRPPSDPAVRSAR